MSAIAIALWLSLQVAVFATAINLVLGIVVAAVLHRYRNPVTAAIETVLTLPMVLPPTVLGYYLLVCLGSSSGFGRWLKSLGIELIFTLNGAIIAAAVVTFPLVLKPIQAAFEHIPTILTDAAKIIGLNYPQTLIAVIVPLAWDSVLAGLLLGFARSLGEFGATLMIAGSIPGETQTISISIWEAVQAGDDALANGLVLVISLVCLLILWAVKCLNKRAWKQQC